MQRLIPVLFTALLMVPAVSAAQGFPGLEARDPAALSALLNQAQQFQGMLGAAQHAGTLNAWLIDPRMQELVSKLRNQPTGSADWQSILQELMNQPPASAASSCSVRADELQAILGSIASIAASNPQLAANLEIVRGIIEAQIQALRQATPTPGDQRCMGYVAPFLQDLRQLIASSTPENAGGFTTLFGDASVQPWNLPASNPSNALERLRALIGEATTTHPIFTAALKQRICLSLSRPLYRGHGGEDVRSLQEFLASLPDIYPEGLVTGHFGELTEKAIKRFQAMHGFEQAGIVGPKTRLKLSELTCATGN